MSAANGFRKQVPAEPKRPPMTIREAVAKHGDDWRLMFPGVHFIKREHMERHTFDSWEALDMEHMERGKKSRIAPADLANSSQAQECKAGGDWRECPLSNCQSKMAYEYSGSTD